MMEKVQADKSQLDAILARDAEQPSAEDLRDKSEEED